MPPKTYSALAKRLHVSTKSLANWRKLPAAPTGTDLAEWKTFIAESGLGVVGNRISKPRERALAANVELRNQLLRVDLAEREHRLVPKDDVNKLLLHVASQQRACLYSTLEREFPGKCVGRTCAEISLLGRDLADRICDIMARELETWRAPHPTDDAKPRESAPVDAKR